MNVKLITLTLPCREDDAAALTAYAAELLKKGSIGMAVMPSQASSPKPVSSGTKLTPWSNPADQETACAVWSAMTPLGRDLIKFLAEHAPNRYSGSNLAKLLGMKSMNGTAGALARPKILCNEHGKHPAFRFEEKPVGESGDFWMETDVAELFLHAAETLGS